MSNDGRATRTIDERIAGPIRLADNTGDSLIQRVGGVFKVSDDGGATFNQPGGVTLPVSIGNGGTGQTTSGAALTALGGASSANVALVLKPTEGAALGDANPTMQPFTDSASQYTLPAATLTTNRTLTLGVTSVITGTLVRIVRKDLTGNTYAVVNGGTSAGTLITFAATPTTIQAATFFYNGSDWVLAGFEYLATS